MAALEDNLRKVPPQNLEAESSVLGGILLENEAINQVLELLRPEDFYRESHRKIFRAMIEITDRSEPVDLITLSEFLKSRNELEAVGGTRLPGVLGRFRADRREYFLLRPHRARKGDSSQLDHHRDRDRHARLRGAGQRRRVSRQRRKSHLRYLRERKSKRPSSPSAT